MNLFMGLLSRDNNTPSIMRFAFVFSILISNLTLWGAWIVMSIYQGNLVNIPSGVVEAYSFANGAAFLGKSMQSFAERHRYNDTNIPMAKSNMGVL